MDDGRQVVVVQLPWKWLLFGQLAVKKRAQKDNEEKENLSQADTCCHI